MHKTQENIHLNKGLGSAFVGLFSILFSFCGIIQYYVIEKGGIFYGRTEA